MGITIKVGLTRKEGTDHYGSIGACCEVDGIEIGPAASMEEIGRVRDHWFDLCERSIEAELHRLRTRDEAAPAAPAPATNGHHHDDYDPAFPEPPTGRSQPAPERVAPAGSVSGRGGRREPGEDDLEEEEEAKPPADGRQLLGWAAKQRPDAKPAVISFGKSRKFPPRVVDWSQDQALKAYLHVRDTAR